MYTEETVVQGRGLDTTRTEGHHGMENNRQGMEGSPRKETVKTDF